jgi:hypothetical protein
MKMAKGWLRRTDFPTGKSCRFSSGPPFERRNTRPGNRLDGQFLLPGLPYLAKGPGTSQGWPPSDEFRQINLKGSEMVFGGIVLTMIMSFPAVLMLIVMMLAEVVLLLGDAASAGYSFKLVS